MTDFFGAAVCDISMSFTQLSLFNLYKKILSIKLIWPSSSNQQPETTAAWFRTGKWVISWMHERRFKEPCRWSRRIGRLIWVFCRWDCSLFLVVIYLALVINTLQSETHWECQSTIKQRVSVVVNQQLILCVLMCGMCQLTVLTSRGNIKTIKKQRNQARRVANKTIRCCLRKSP